jgi:methionyl-tRNA formyltransferase
VGAWLELPGGDRLGVQRAAPAGADGPAPGELACRGEQLVFGAADGALELLQVQPAGGRPMDAAAWVRGHQAVLAGHNDESE